VGGQNVGDGITLAQPANESRGGKAMIDGQIEYSIYSRNDLIDCVQHIDPERFPVNHANALRELQSRPRPEFAPQVAAPVATTRRPIGVWVVFLVYVVADAVLVPTYFLTRSGSLSLKMSPAQQAYFGRLTFFDDVSVAIMFGLTLYAAVSLLRLRRSAYYAFSIAWVFNVGLTVWAILARDYLSVVHGSNLIGLLGALLVCVYCRSLLKRGVLR